MWKKHKTTIILTSLITLLPILIGAILWNKLPDVMPRHWGLNGEVDGWSGKAFVVFGIPLIMFAFHWLIIGLTNLDKRNVKQNSKALSVIYFLFPVVSLMACATTYSAALDREFDLFALAPMLMGLLFIVIGNYSPKTRLNATLGIKIPWTLANEQNWNRTHRFGGKVWVIGGALMLFTGFLLTTAFAAVFVGLLLMMIILPVLYSYLDYRKQKAAGTWEVNGVMMDPRTTRISAIFIVIILAFVAVLLFTGNIEYTLNEDHVAITASYWADSTIPYADITAIEYRENGVDGIRTSGFGSPQLSMGQFRNDEFGYYTRYTYTRCDSAIVLTLGDRIAVISGKDADSTRALYDSLLPHIAQ